MENTPFQRIILTGAAGRLGKALRPGLRALCETLVLSDRIELDEAPAAGEEFIPCELADHPSVSHLLEGADLVVHMGGISQECSFDALLHSNLIGQFNLYDNALAHGVKRIVLASTNHVTGFYPVEQLVTPHMPVRPDSLYAISKCYGETLARFFHDRHGLESVCLRIGNCSPRPLSLRALSCWLSHADLCELVRCAALTPHAGFAIVYGTSANAATWWDGDDAARIGYRPHDSSEIFRAELLATAGNQAKCVHQGGNPLNVDYRQPATWNNRRLSR
ncbi:NAD(P)-dependent oxidoreductase [Uliginosibacterium sp. 31-16]|uniref:NAD-dependent epimerase/dehydratase family protein n=1 Tax=Uliginosibacterium sp. 31-16 TaxID=3068315 RepID=UPI00273D87B3|nr:NAD(P)-dependent oxidoreductase [Uliginosibacterium sp. 31-16]MDP5239433.1 NAD(P)-dependent oxidoreductase [Uliginosibacterium sp. 31-16]